MTPREPRPRSSPRTGSTCSISAFRWRARSGPSSSRPRISRRIPGAGPGTERPSSSPIPIASGDASFTFQGRTFTLPVNNGPNAIHGFAVNVPWRVRRARGRRELGIHRRPLPDLARDPEDAAALANRRRPSGPLRPGRPAADHDHHGLEPHRGRPALRLRNPSVLSGCRSHPGAISDRTRVIVPAGRFWVLEDFLPTGETRPVDTRLDFRAGQPMTGLKLDDVLTGPGLPGGSRGLPAGRPGQEGRVPARIRSRVPGAGRLHSPRPARCDLARAVHPDDRRDPPAGPGSRRRAPRSRAREAGAIRHHHGIRGMTGERQASRWRPRPAAPSFVDRPPGSDVLELATKLTAQAFQYQ